MAGESSYVYEHISMFVTDPVRRPSSKREGNVFSCECDTPTPSTFLTLLAPPHPSPSPVTPLPSEALDQTSPFSAPISSIFEFSYIS